MASALDHPPLIFQVLFGGDILWKYRKLALFGISVPTIYLSIADYIAINTGTWIINPDRTLGIYFRGVLPLEEFTFFLFTNVLIAFGIILISARESQERLPKQLLEKLEDMIGDRYLSQSH